MSIRVMDAVWTNSAQKGTRLLALLALADWCNDRGECDPSYNQLADKIRVDRIRARRIVADLIAAGDVAKEVGAGHKFGKGMVSNRLLLARYVADPRGASAPTLGAPVPLPLGAPVPPSTSNNNGQHNEEAPNGATAAKPRTSRKPPPDPRIATLLAGLAEVRGYPITEWGADGAAAKRGLAAGYEPDAILDCARSMVANSFWQDKPLSMASVV